MQVFEKDKQQDKRKILLLFDDVDELPIEVFSSFESRLIELMNKNENMRAVMSSRKKIAFQAFERLDRIDELNKSMSFKRR